MSWSCSPRRSPRGPSWRTSSKASPTVWPRSTMPRIGWGCPSAPLPDRAGLLLISSRDAPSPAIAELCWRKGLTIYQPQPGEDVQALLASMAPAALAWDLGHATPADWLLVQQLRGYPQVCQAPFILYG